MKFRIWKLAGNDPEVKKKAFTFLLCLVFSFIAWLFIKLSKETSTIVPVRVEVVNIPENLLFTGQSDSTFVLSIETTGIRILSNKAFRRINLLEADFASLQRVRDQENQFFFTASQAEVRFSVLNDISRTNLSAHPDTMFFQGSNAFIKKVPVVVDKQIDYRPGFKLYDFPQIDPDSIYVRGPVDIKDSVNYIPTQPLRQKMADRDIEQQLDLINPFPTQQVSLSDQHVMVRINIEEFTEDMIELPVLVECPDIKEAFPDSRILLFPDRVNVFYLVALKDMNTISPDMFSVKVQCPDTLSTNQTRLRIRLVEQPGLVELSRIRPSEVEYVWIKN